jgi:hypothetical protein
MSLTAFKVVAGSVALMSLGAGVASAAASSPARPADWRPGLAGVAGTTTAVTGVRAAGTTTEFAFIYSYPTHQMYVRTNGKAWVRKSGPVLANGEMVVAAKAITANHLVVFTVLINGTSRVLDYYQGKWTVIGKFGAPIGTATVLSGSDIWVFGTTVHKALGVWHYDGRSWKRVATSGADGSGVTATGAWAVNGTVVEHRANGKWTGTNLASLIPQALIGAKTLIGVYATPGAPVYAVGTGNNEDTGGPLVVLRFNGHGWTKVAGYSHGNMMPTAVSPDGSGGLLIGGSSGAGGPAELLHYAKGSGKLVAEAVPGMTNMLDSAFFTAANVPGTTVAIVGGTETVKGGAEKATVYTTN